MTQSTTLTIIENMKANHKILYHCGENSSHRLLLVRKGSSCDSWSSYVYEEATGKEISARNSGHSVDRAEHLAQLQALKAGISPILSNRADFDDSKAVHEITGDVFAMDYRGIDPLDYPNFAARLFVVEWSDRSGWYELEIKSGLYYATVANETEEFKTALDCQEWLYSRVEKIA